MLPYLRASGSSARHRCIPKIGCGRTKIVVWLDCINVVKWTQEKAQLVTRSSALSALLTSLLCAAVFFSPQRLAEYYWDLNPI